MGGGVQPDSLSSEKILPREIDITCGRGKHRWKTAGNIRYKRIIWENLSRYSNATRKREKTKVVREAMRLIKSDGCRFIKKDQKMQQWKELTPQETVTKVAHAFRDFLYSCDGKTEQPLPLVLSRAMKKRVAATTRDP